MKAIAVVAIGFLIAGVSVTAASASPMRESAAQVCVPSAGQEYVAPTYEDQLVTPAGWQRHSWTGGPWVSDAAPPFPGDAGDWTDNVAGDPHNVGVEGAYFRSNGNSGNGDWFHLGATPAVYTSVMTDPGQPYIAPVVCEQPPTNYCNPAERPAGMSIAQWLNEGQFNGADCFTITPNLQCGSFNATVDGPLAGYTLRYLEGAGMTPDLSTGMALPATFGEDYNGGSVQITVWLEGPESDYLTGTALPNYWDGTGYTVAIDTDCVDSEPEIVSEWYTWDTGSWAPDATYGSDVNWPQTLVGLGQIAPTVCETTYQQDRYVGTRAEIDAVVGDDLLVELSPGRYEDRNIVKEWRFVSSGPCAAEVTPASPTVAPLCGPNNDTVTIPSTTGVIYSDTGWFEGERTITATADDGYVLAEGKWSWTFTDEAAICPIEITDVSVTVTDPPICGPNNDPVNIPDVEGLTFEDTGWVDGERTITATADPGYVLDGESEWTFFDEATVCPVTTVAPTVVAVCLPNNDTVTIPAVQGVIYTDSGWVGGERTITASADDGYVLEGLTSWTFTDVPVAACPDEPPAFSYTPTGELAYSGASTSTNGLTALAIFLMASGTALVALKTRAAR